MHWKPEGSKPHLEEGREGGGIMRKESGCLCRAAAGVLVAPVKALMLFVFSPAWEEVKVGIPVPGGWLRASQLLLGALP